MLIAGELQGIFGSDVLHTYSFEQCPVTGKLNGDETLSSIILPVDEFSENAHKF